MEENISYNGVSNYNLFHLVGNVFKAVNNNYAILSLIDYTDRHNSDGEQKKIIDDERVKNTILKNSFEDFYKAIMFFRRFSNNDYLKSTLKSYEKDLRTSLLHYFSSKVSLLGGMINLTIDEQIDLLNQVVKKARKIGVSEDCIRYFDNKRIKLMEKNNNSNNNKRTNIM